MTLNSPGVCDDLSRTTTLLTAVPVTLSLSLNVQRVPEPLVVQPEPPGTERVRTTCPDCVSTMSNVNPLLAGSIAGVRLLSTNCPLIFRFSSPLGARFLVILSCDRSIGIAESQA